MVSKQAWFRFDVCILVLAIVAGGGCRSEVAEIATAAADSKYLLASEPAGALGVAAVRKTLASAVSAGPVVICGTIPPDLGDGHASWDEQSLMWMIVDATAADGEHDHSHDHGHSHDEHEHAGEHHHKHADEHGPGHDHAHGHDHDNCPFCERGKTLREQAAIVQLVDAGGKVVRGDPVRELGLKPGQYVVADGVAEFDALGNLVVSAKAVYVRGG